MRVLLAQRWADGFLDETPTAGLARVRPAVWITLVPVDDQFFVRSGGSRALAAYTREFGARAVARKTASRLRERDRNRRYVGVGLGTIEPDPSPTSEHRTGEHWASEHWAGESRAGEPPAREPSAGVPTAGSPVAFVAPCHPACMERVVLHRDLIRPLRPADVPRAADHGARSGRATIVHRARPASPPPAVDDALVGWSPMAGIELDPAAVDRLVAWLAIEWRGARPDDRLLTGASPITTSTRRGGGGGGAGAAPPPPPPPPPPHRVPGEGAGAGCRARGV
ncbi:hypothetical protein ND748_26295, partial [Frankia sp. AiPs1]|nr:hypothetical protein [Frankia sp. AiPs1]